MEYRNYEQMGEATYTLIPATIIMALGIFFFILGLVGCVGAFKEQRCMLGVVRLKSATISLHNIMCKLSHYLYLHFGIASVPVQAQLKFCVIKPLPLQVIDMLSGNEEWELLV